ncbi:hypothetical protein Nepgr_033393 [Nepenthes gracilis]|uniref:Uncharacterized protein n=1 Tax=Nepenthes gracilis TaxID=150966 RepID=A0AAD3TLZ3_NEPGR|nr:hypothetical protein Nepgr_033393 [Nepenthes gracilis]
MVESRSERGLPSANILEPNRRVLAIFKRFLEFSLVIDSFFVISAINLSSFRVFCRCLPAPGVIVTTQLLILTTLLGAQQRDGDFQVQGNCLAYTLSFQMHHLVNKLFDTSCIAMLRKEKDLLKESQSQSNDLIKRLELHVERLTEACNQDKKQIQELERELDDCFVEINHLRCQLNVRNAEVDCLGEHASSLELKLADMAIFQEEVASLRDCLKRSNSECLFLKEELGSKEIELQKSTLYVEKLEESISSAALESQCEIETLRLDMMALEQSCFEAKKSEEESNQEKTRMEVLIHEQEVQIEAARKTIGALEKENKELKAMLNKSEINARLFRQRIEEHFKEWLESKRLVQVNMPFVSSEHNNECVASEEVGVCGEVLGPLLSKLLKLGTPDAGLKDDAKTTSSQIHEYELLVNQLKEELRVQKLKAKEEAEDLTQEMAELRYQMIELLEEERRRRVCIEQASLHRIAELEAQVLIERRKSFASTAHMNES